MNTTTTTSVASLSYKILDGSWPVLDQLPDIPPAIRQEAYTSYNSSLTGSYLGYFDLGLFYIHTSLLKPHPTQRSVSLAHIQTLQQSFTETGIRRAENPGVVIGLGNGWLSMKNNHPVPIMITSSFPYLDKLQGESNSAIGEIIRGNHRTIAMWQLSEQQQENDRYEPFWLYKVLIPGIVL